MKYAFNDFVFDSEQLTLYKNNEVVACRYNEAKLLALFLSEPARIFSKDDILKRVWAGKVVSEQAVFQNISVLRTLFGENAIKTFSKKGYQWQLALNACVDEAPISSPAALATKSSGRRPGWIIAIGVFAVVAMFSVVTWQSRLPDENLTSIALLPILLDPNSQQNHTLKTELIDPISESLTQGEYFQPVVVSNLKNYDDFYYSPQKYYDQLAAQTQSGIIFLAWVGKNNNNFFIRYVLKSGTGGWSATLQAKTVSLLLEKLNTNIALILQSEILNVNSSNSALINAKLKILHQQSANDHVVMSRLAESEISNGNANNAILLAADLATKARLQSDTTLEGDSYVISANAHIAQSLYDEAESYLQKAALLFQSEQNYRGLHDVQHAYASLAFAKNDYGLLKKSLMSAIEFAQFAKDPLLEVRDNTYLSIMANKFGETKDRQTYLDRAELILDQSHQSTEHYGIIYFYAGMYADNEALAEKNYRKVLSVLPAGQIWWEGERAQVHLADLFIKQARWQEALDLFSGKEPLSASEAFTISTIYYSQQLWSQAEAHAMSAFKLASLSGQTFLALDVALRLVDINQHSGTPERAQAQLQFLQREAKNVPYWIKFNKTGLERLGIKLEP